MWSRMWTKVLGVATPLQDPRPQLLNQGTLRGPEWIAVLLTELLTTPSYSARREGDFPIDKMKMSQLVAQHPAATLGLIGNCLQYVSQILCCRYQPHFCFNCNHHLQLWPDLQVPWPPVSLVQPTNNNEFHMLRPLKHHDPCEKLHNNGGETVNEKLDCNTIPCNFLSPLFLPKKCKRQIGYNLSLSYKFHQVRGPLVNCSIELGSERQGCAMKWCRGIPMWTVVPKFYRTYSLRYLLLLRLSVSEKVRDQTIHRALEFLWLQALGTWQRTVRIRNQSLEAPPEAPDHENDDQRLLTIGRHLNHQLQHQHRLPEQPNARGLIQRALPSCSLTRMYCLLEFLISIHLKDTSVLCSDMYSTLF